MPHLFRKREALQSAPVQQAPATVESLEARQLLAAVDGFTQSEFTRGLSGATALAVAPDGRLFVAEQRGTVRIVTREGELLSEPFFSVQTEVAGERGLIGITLDPQFELNGFVYLYYTVTGAPPHNRIARVTAIDNVAAPGSFSTLFEVDSLVATAHNGGAMHFGPDGKLYVAVGDNVYPQSAQSLNTVHGKMLRLNRDGSIPADNPFFDSTTGINRSIWATGLRNPFTFAFEPGTGRMLINDVGQNAFEEINEGVAGANYGWPEIEGSRTDQTPPPNYRDPIHAYGRSFGCAVTGGVFYNPPNAPPSPSPEESPGNYFFGDQCAGSISRLNPQTGNVTNFATGLNNPVDLDVTADGTLLALSYFDGTIMTFRSTSDVEPPAIARHPINTTARLGQPATFEVEASGYGPFTYQWQRNGQDISGATDAVLTLASTTQEDDGAEFRAIVRNDVGQIESVPARLAMISANAPFATITAPAPRSTQFVAGRPLAFAGTATTAGGEPLPASAFSWRVDYHTGPIARPFLPESAGAQEGEFFIPAITPFTTTNVFYRIYLTVTDQGESTTVFSDIPPQVSTFRLQSSPAGVPLTLDGQPISGGETLTGVAGLSRTLSAPAKARVDGIVYQFVAWAHGGARTQLASTALNDTTFTALYEPLSGGSGGGLLGTYFRNTDFTGASVSRVDPVIDLDSTAASLDAAIGSGRYSARWTGTISPQFSEEYTFLLTAGGGGRLLLDGRPVLDKLRGRKVEASAAVTLEAGRDYEIEVQFVQRRKQAGVQLQWSSASTPLEVVPATRLAPPLEAEVNFDLLPTQDARVQAGRQSGRNFGRSRTLRVGSSETLGSMQESFFTFDLTTLGAFDSAALTLTGKMTGRGANEMQVGVYDVEETAWNAAAITFDTRPAAGRAPVATLGASRGKKRAYHVDLTSYLLAQQAAGKTAVSFALKSLTPGPVFTLVASEGRTEIPRLTVTTGT